MKKIIWIMVFAILVFVGIALPAKGAEWNSHIDITDVDNWEMIDHTYVAQYNAFFDTLIHPDQKIKVVQSMRNDRFFYIQSYCYVFEGELYMWVWSYEDKTFLRYFPDAQSIEKIKENHAKLKRWVELKKGI